MKNRLTNYNFWVSIISAVLLILQALKIEFDIAYINEIATAVLGLLVVIGIVSDPTKISVRADLVSTETKTTKKIEGQTVAQNSLDEQSKIKELADEQTLEKEVNVPSETKDEVDSSLDKNDFKDLVNKISEDLQQEKEVLLSSKSDLFSAIGEVIKIINASNAKEEKIQPEDNCNNEEAKSEKTCFNIVND